MKGYSFIFLEETKISNIEGIREATGVGFRKHITDYSTDIIAIPYNHIGNNEYVTYETDELTSVCPVSGLPDFAKLTILYVPGKLLPELKTLKFYLMSFRDVGILHEDLCQVILKEFYAKIKPLWVKVTLKVKPRGGIYTTVDAELGYETLGR